jgi:sugar lactone lactonase YvrE
VGKVPLGGGPSTILASGLQEPWAIAVDAQSVYWNDAEASTISKVPLAGGPTTVLATAQSGAWGIALDATRVYWTASGGVFSAPVNGGNLVTLASGQVNPSSIAVDSANVYFTTYAQDGAVLVVPFGGGTPMALSALSESSSPFGLATDDQSLYWADYANGAVMKRTPK